MSINVTLLGNLVNDPELRKAGENDVCTFRVASNGYKKDDATFVDVECWGKQAINCEKYLEKGRKVFVNGTLRQDNWKDKATGDPRSKLYINGRDIQFVDFVEKDSSAKQTTSKNSSDDDDDLPF